MEINTCSVCHQPILPTYYFCPNCGHNLNTAPLSTTAGKQIGLYLFSLILPFICFIFVTRWQGLKYFKSVDPKAKRVGEVACILLILSTVVAIYFVWFSTVTLQQQIQTAVDSLTGDLNNLNF